MPMSRTGLSSLMGYQEGGGVDLADIEDANEIINSASSNEVSSDIGDQSAGIAGLTQEELLKEFNKMQGGEGDVTSQFLQYRKMLNDIMPPRPRASGYDLASSLGKGLLSQQSEKFPSMGRGVGLGFQDFNKLQKEIDEANRKDRQSRDLTAFGMVTKKKSSATPKALPLYTNDDGANYQALLIGDEIFYKGEGQTLGEVDFYEKFKGTNMRPTTPSEDARGIPTYESFKKLSMDVLSEEQAMGKLQSYLENQKDRKVGFQLLADDFAGYVKTFLGQNEGLTEDELKKRILESNFQGLMGGFRIETVGPGVMTEYDAQRIVQSLGGEPGALQSPEAVARVLKKVFERKVERYNELLSQYNYSVAKQYGQGGFFEQKELVKVDPKLFEFDIKFPQGATNKKTNDDGSLEYVLKGRKYRLKKDGILDDLGSSDAGNDDDFDNKGL